MISDLLLEPIVLGAIGAPLAATAVGLRAVLRGRDAAVRARGETVEATVLAVEAPLRPIGRSPVTLLLTVRYPGTAAGSVTRPMRYKADPDRLPLPGWTLPVKVHPENPRRAAPVGEAVPPGARRG